jgi:hypothetical protein
VSVLSVVSLVQLFICLCVGGRGRDFVEMDVNVHKFNSLSKQALQILFNRFEEMIISFGFCVESRGDDEMPETLFGSVTLNCPNHSESVPWGQL